MDDDNSSGGRIIITTRKLEVAKKADEVYKLQPLSYDRSRELFLARISGQQGKYVHNEPDEILDKFIRKCSGIPLAIITMASILAGKKRDEWNDLYNTIDFGSKDNKESENTMRILSFSYYDLPSHLRTCLLYLSAFPEDFVVLKVSLVWMWVAEGFVHKKEGIRLFEIGEGYFNDLINRSMIQAVESYDETVIIGCRVHDIVHDFIRSMSREEKFFTILENNQDTLLQSNARRLANYSTKGLIHQSNHIQMPKLRSFISLRPATETWGPHSSWTLLRVLALENCRATGHIFIRVEHLGHLLHLRFLSLRRTRIRRIPEGIGALRFLQTMDLWGSDISEMPSSGSLPKRLACLSISLERYASDGKVFSVEEMTSLEELTIQVPSWLMRVGWHVDGLRCLSELIVLNIIHFFWDEEGKRDLLESLRHLSKLQRLTIKADYSSPDLLWLATDLVVPHQLQHLFVECICFRKLPPCITPSCVPNLSHLDLELSYLEDDDLKSLSSLPELHYLSLKLCLWSPGTIHNISDSDVCCYFPKLQCFRLKNSMFSFITNKDDNTVSFHIWTGYYRRSWVSYGVSEIARPSVSDNESMPSVSDDELESGHETQSPRPSVSHDVELHKPLKSSKLQQGLKAVTFYFLAFFLPALAYVMRWPLKIMGQHHPLPCNRASSPGNGNGEDPAAMPSISDGRNKGSTICSKGTSAALPRFMPSLQVLHFDVRRMPHIRCFVYNLGWEHLSAPREINVTLLSSKHGFNEILETELTRAAQVHPKHPKLSVQKSRY